MRLKLRRDQKTQRNEEIFREYQKLPEMSTSFWPPKFLQNQQKERSESYINGHHNPLENRGNAKRLKIENCFLMVIKGRIGCSQRRRKLPIHQLPVDFRKFPKLIIEQTLVRA